MENSFEFLKKLNVLPYRPEIPLLIHIREIRTMSTQKLVYTCA